MLGLVGVLLLAACDDADPVKIGFIGGLSGRSADLGESSRNAVQLAVEEINAAGGIKGRAIELVVRDDRNDPETAGRAVADLHEAGVAAIIGPNNSSIAAGMLDVLNAREVVTVSPTVSSLVFADLDDHFFRINWTTRDNAKIYARQYADRGIRRIAAAIDANNRVFTESWLNEFRKAFAALGGTVVATDVFDAKQERGYSDSAANLLKDRADAVLMVANSVDTAQLAQQIRKLDKTILLITSEWAASERLLELGGAAIEGLELVQSYDRTDRSERYSRFRDLYRERFQRDPGFASVAAHDAASILFAAMTKQKEGASLKQAMLSVGTVPGLQQEIGFNKYGDAQRRAFFVVVRDGKFLPL